MVNKTVPNRKLEWKLKDTPRELKNWKNWRLEKYGKLNMGCFFSKIWKLVNEKKNYTSKNIFVTKIGKAPPTNLCPSQIEEAPPGCWTPSCPTQNRFFPKQILPHLIMGGATNYGMYIIVGVWHTRPITKSKFNLGTGHLSKSTGAGIDSGTMKFFRFIWVGHEISSVYLGGSWKFPDLFGWVMKFPAFIWVGHEIL